MIFETTLHVGGRSFIRNLSKHHAVVTGDPRILVPKLHNAHIP